MSWAFFDLNGTLLDPGELAEPLQRALQFAWVTTLTGAYQPFDVLVGWALGEPVSDRLETMPPQEGAAEALGGLRSAGLRLGVLTQSRTATGRAALEHAGLIDHVDLVLGTDQTEAFKPDARPYAHAVTQTGGPPSEVWLVAAHWWDVLGATRVGLRTAFVGPRDALPGLVAEPDVVGADLSAVAAEVTRRTAAAS